MSDTYGKLIFSRSSDSEIDLNSLLKTLNALRWENNGGLWAIEDELIYFSNPHAQYPNVDPPYTEVCYCQDDKVGKAYTKKKEEMTEADWENFLSADEVDLSLDQLAKVISTNIQKGWIEVSYSSSEGNHFTESGCLRVYSDGHARRQISASGIGMEPVNEVEVV
jgi:hypothetical protein